MSAVAAASDVRRFASEEGFELHQAPGDRPAHARGDQRCETGGGGVEADRVVEVRATRRRARELHHADVFAHVFIFTWLLRELVAMLPMGDPGFEPGTSSLSETRSNQLS